MRVGSIVSSSIRRNVARKDLHIGIATVLVAHTRYRLGRAINPSRE